MSGDNDKPRYFSFAERQRQKALSRQRDEERLQRGEITPRELQRENYVFSHIKFEWFAFRNKDGSLHKYYLDRGKAAKGKEKP